MLSLFSLFWISIYAQNVDFVNASPPGHHGWRKFKTIRWYSWIFFNHGGLIEMHLGTFYRNKIQNFLQLWWLIEMYFGKKSTKFLLPHGRLIEMNYEHSMGTKSKLFSKTIVDWLRCILEHARGTKSKIFSYHGGLIETHFGIL